MGKKKGQFFKTVKVFVKENLLMLSTALFGISLVALLVSGVAWFAPDRITGGLKDMAEFMGNWKYWIFLLSAFLICVAVYFMYTNYQKRTRFNEMIHMDSKAEFVKNLDDLEYLAFQLGPRYEDKVWDKKQTFKIK